MMLLTYAAVVWLLWLVGWCWQTLTRLRDERTEAEMRDWADYARMLGAL